MDVLILFLVLAEIATVSFCLLHCWFLFINNITALVYILDCSIAVIKHWIKEASRGDVLFCFHFLITVHYWRKTGQKLKQEQRKEPQRNSAYWLALHCLLRSICTGIVWPTVCLASTRQLAISERSGQTCLKARLMETSFPKRFTIQRYICVWSSS